MKNLLFLSLLITLLLSSSLAYAQDEDAVVIRLERTACFGTCPVYSIAIHESGTINYLGQEFVTVEGEASNSISPELVTQIVQAFEDAGYFEWDEAYDDQSVTDLPTVITSVTRDGETHQITRYAGDESTPLALIFLELWLEEVTYTTGWTGVQTDISLISHAGNLPLITMETTMCFGSCPVYKVAAYEDGTVVFMGIQFVDAFGVTIREEDESLESIVDMAKSFAYFDWEDNYTEMAFTDAPTTITSIRREDEVKRITRYGGDPNAPVGLTWIEDRIESLVTDLIGSD